MVLKDMKRLRKVLEVRGVVFELLVVGGMRVEDVCDGSVKAWQ